MCSEGTSHVESSHDSGYDRAGPAGIRLCRFLGIRPRDLLNLAIVLVAPPLMFWLIVRPIKAEKVAQRKAAELEGKP